jgi:hypothetical protein
MGSSRRSQDGLLLAGCQRRLRLLASKERVINPPQVTNLPHKQDC